MASFEVDGERQVMVEAVTAKVTVPVKEEPVPGFMTAITFGGLVAEVRVPRDSRALVTSWRVGAIGSFTAEAGPALASKTATAA